MSFIFHFFSTIVMVPLCIGNFTLPNTVQLIEMILAGCSAACGQFCITAAYGYAPASEISIYDYAQVIFSAVLGLIFFEQMPDVLSFIGYIIVIIMALLNFYYNKRRAS